MPAIKALVNEAPCAGFALGIPNRWGWNWAGASRTVQPQFGIQEKVRTGVPGFGCHASTRPIPVRKPSVRHPFGDEKVKRSQKGAVDDVAAALILQRFLDERSR